MNRTLLIIVTLMICLNSFSQTSFSYRDREIQIGAISPTFIKSVKYNESTDEYTSIQNPIQLSIFTQDSIKYFKIINLKTIQKEDAQLISSIITNEKSDSSKIIADCYIPRHVILLKNEMGRIEKILELCFECERNKYFSSDGLSELNLSSNQYMRLKKIFELYKK